MKYEGEMFINNIQLTDIKSASTSTMGMPSNSINVGGNTIKLAPGECEVFDLYDIIAFQCSTGDWPGECMWEQNPGSMEAYDYLPGYRLEIVGTYVNCAPPEPLPPPGSGGGNTTPNPPGGYDPCDGDNPTQSSIKKSGGFNLSALPLNPCDGDGNPPVNAVAVLINDLQITDEIKQGYLYSNTGAATTLYNYLATNGWTSGNIEFIEWAIGYLAENPFEDANYLIANRSTLYYTNAEMEAMIDAIEDPITGNGIDLYLVMKYQGSKLFELSRYSKAGNSVQAGAYTLTPHYSKNGTLLFYAAGRGSQNGIEYIVKANQISSFTAKVDYYTAAADLVYMNGIPSKGMIQAMSGDRIDGLVNLWGQAFKSLEYWGYLITCFVMEPSNPKIKAAIEDAIPTGAPYTKSSLEYGRQVHSQYKAGLQDNVYKFKEFTGIPGIRPDFVDFNTKTIFELKPNNPRQVAAGNAQLATYKTAFEAKYGGNWNIVLDLY
ncbi:Restriction endonuclease fold toxin 9 [compost metagenome]